MIRSEAARFVDFDRVMPGLQSRRSGCWIGYQVGAWSPGKPSLTNVQVIDDPFASIGHPVQPEQPARAPQLAGYRFVEGALAFSPDYKWVGLWVANGRAKRSLIAAFDDSHHKLLA